MGDKREGEETEDPGLLSLVTQVGSRLKVKENQTEVSRVETDARDRSHERTLSPPVWVPN